jgi:squalene-hopene/tetraprenyl-beta-curcumene cyclase
MLMRCLVLSLTLVTLGSAKESDPTWEQMVDRTIGYFRKTQAPDGSWGGKVSPGITGIVLTGLLKTGRLKPDDPMIESALGYIETLVHPEEGHLAGKGAAVKLQNYVTSVNVMALVEANRPKYKTVIDRASKFLRKLQWDEGESKAKDDAFYGGAGYDSKSRPDLSNTQLFLDALVAAGVPKDDPAFKKALVFVSRCQNLDTEFNDQPWAKKINDGSFIYTPALGGDTKVAERAELGDRGFPGYGSMTYAGVKSMIYCGVDAKDPRMKKAREWLAKNYTVDANPGMPEARATWGLYYYYHTMAKTLDALGEDKVKDAKGVEHDWRADLNTALAKRQRPDGSFRNEAANWMEAEPALVGGYVLMTLSYTKPKK